MTLSKSYSQYFISKCGTVYCHKVKFLDGCTKAFIVSRTVEVSNMVSGDSPRERQPFHWGMKSIHRTDAIEVVGCHRPKIARDGDWDGLNWVNGSEVIP